jgi:superfamily I DNA/RNA helicase
MRSRSNADQLTDERLGAILLYCHAATTADTADLLRRERSLFYAAATRAGDELVVVWERRGSGFPRPSSG